MGESEGDIDGFMLGVFDGEMDGLRVSSVGGSVMIFGNSLIPLKYGAYFAHFPE